VALNAALIGRTYPPGAPYLVGREKIREFAAAVGDDAPAFHDVAAARGLGYRDLVAPPTFAIIVSNRGSATAMFDPELGLDYSRVVHGEQRFAYRRPIEAGDELLTTTTIENIRAVAGNDVLTVRSDITDVAGAPVVTAWAVIVARGTAGGA